MKRVTPLLAFLIVAITSCEKKVDDIAKESVPQSTLNSSDMNAVISAAPTRFGALQGGNFLNPERENIYRNLGIKYIRYTIVMDHWTGVDKGFERYKNDGFHIILNVNLHDQSTTAANAVPFAKDTAAYARKLSAILDKYKPEVLVIENEETNLIFHYGSIHEYINMLKAATAVAHARGIKITDGGIHPRGICYFVWQDYMHKGMTQQANSWMNTTMPADLQYAATHPGVNNSIRDYWHRLDTLLNAFARINLDFVNIHLYEPINNMGDGKYAIPGAIQTTADYIRRRTGKPVLSNECGQHNNYATCVTSMMNAFVDGDYKYAIWNSSDGTQSKSLINDNESLRPSGFAFKSFMSTY